MCDRPRRFKIVYLLTLNGSLKSLQSHLFLCIFCSSSLWYVALLGWEMAALGLSCLCGCLTDGASIAWGQKARHLFTASHKLKAQLISHPFHALFIQPPDLFLWSLRCVARHTDLFGVLSQQTRDVRPMFVQYIVSTLGECFVFAGITKYNDCFFR